MRQITFILLTILSTQVAGCQFFEYGFGPHPRVPLYGFGFSNSTGEAIDKVMVEFISAGRTYKEEVGFLSPRVQKSNIAMPDPIPATGTVSWESPDGARHSKGVDIATRIKDLQRFEGTIWFRITDAGVDVLPITDEERADGKKP